VGLKLETAFYSLPFVNSFYMSPFRSLFEFAGGSGVLLLLNMILLLFIMYFDPAIPFPGGRIAGDDDAK
jgi:hypothetical protein